MIKGYIFVPTETNKTKLYIMKYLSDYQKDAQTKLWEETGSFFAFSDEQFKEGIAKAKDQANINGYEVGDKWARMGHGLFSLSKHADHVIKQLETISKEARATDLKENGKEGVIKRELHNYECFYACDISDAYAVLKDYGFTEAEVIEVYRKEFKNAMEYY